MVKSEPGSEKKMDATTFTQLLNKSIAGDPSAQMAVAACYYTGKGTEKNEKAARHWFEKSAEQGNPDALYTLGSLYLTGSAMVAPDPEKAVTNLKAAALQNHSAAQLLLGICYRQGRGVPKDPYQSVLWLHLATENYSDYF